MTGPVGIDTSRPNIARVYDYWLGGQDNFQADRDTADRMAAACPALPQMARQNRAFVTAAASRAAGEGSITQFIDLGAGLPVRPAVHDTARSVTPAARVLYVDNDPVVASHGRALLAKGDGLGFLQADLAAPATVLAAAETVRDRDGDGNLVIDLDQPVGVILGAVLHFMDSGKAAQVVSGYAEHAAPGSWIIASVAHIADPHVLAELKRLYKDAGEYHNHTARDLAAILGGLEVVEPGITSTRRWVARIAGGAPAACRAYMLAAAAVKH